MSVIHPLDLHPPFTGNRSRPVSLYRSVSLFLTEYRGDISPIVSKGIKQVVGFKHGRKVVDLNDVAKLLWVQPDVCIGGEINAGVEYGDVPVFELGFDLIIKKNERLCENRQNKVDGNHGKRCIRAHSLTARTNVFTIK